MAINNTLRWSVVLILISNNSLASGVLDAWTSEKIETIYEQEDTSEQLKSLLFDSSSTKIPLNRRPNELKWGTDPLYTRIKFHAAIQNTLTSEYTIESFKSKFDYSDKSKHKKIALDYVKDTSGALITCVAGVACLAPLTAAFANAGYEAAFYHMVERPDLVKKFQQEFDPKNFNEFNEALEFATQAAEDKINVINQAIKNSRLLKDEGGKKLLKILLSNKKIPKAVVGNIFGKEIPTKNGNDLKQELINSARNYHKATAKVAAYGNLGLQAADLLGLDVPNEIRKSVNIIASTATISGLIASQNYVGAASAGLQLLGSVFGSKKSAKDAQFEFMQKQFKQINVKLDKLLENQIEIINRLDELSKKIDESETRLTKLIIHISNITNNLVLSKYYEEKSVCSKISSDLKSNYWNRLNKMSLINLSYEFLDNDTNRRGLFNCWEFINKILLLGSYSNALHPYLKNNPNEPISSAVREEEKIYNEYISQFKLFPVLRDFKSLLGDEEKLSDLYSILSENIDFDESINGNDQTHIKELKKLFTNNVTVDTIDILSLSIEHIDANMILQLVKQITELHEVISLSQSNKNNRREYKKYLSPFKKLKRKEKKLLPDQKKRIKMDVIDVLYQARFHLALAKYQSTLWDGTGMIRQVKNILIEADDNKLNELGFILYGDKKRNPKYPGHKYLLKNSVIYMINNILNELPFGFENYSQAVASGNEDTINQFITLKLHKFLGLNEKTEIKVTCKNKLESRNLNMCSSLDYGENSTEFEINIKIKNNSFTFPLPGWETVKTLNYDRLPEYSQLTKYEVKLNSLIADYNFTPELAKEIFQNSKERKAFLNEYNTLLVINSIDREH